MSATIKRKSNDMKAKLVSLFRQRLARGGALLVVAGVIAASIAWSENPQARVKLGGIWVGELDGVQWVSIHSPLDADGKTAAAKLQWLAISAPFQYLAATLGTDRMSEAVGSFEMIKKDTAKYTLTWYIVASGTPSTTAPVGDQVKAVAVMTGMWHYTGPDTAESTETLKMYMFGDNAAQHLFPTPEDTTLIFQQTFDWHPQYRL